MIKDTLLICSLVICFVLLYRIYIVGQKINNLEEKINVLDNFSQSIFNYLSTKEEQAKEDVITYSNNQQNTQQNQQNVEQNTQQNIQQNVQQNVQQNIISNNEEESEDENTNQYNIIQPINQFEDKLTENFESREVISEMVSQLKETLIQTNMDNLQKELEEVSELKETLIQHNKEEEEKDETTPNDLYNLLNNTFNSTEPKLNLKEFESETVDKTSEKKAVVNNKKKEEELMKMKMQELKDLAKKKNIKVMDKSNKPKKKEVLVKELLSL